MRRLAIARRLSWGVADQAVSSLENFLLGAYVARELGAQELGALALAFLAYAVVQNLSRALATDPLTVRHSGSAVDEWHRAVAASTGVALLVGTATGAGCALLGGVLLLAGHHAVGVALVALAPGLPGLTLQDSWRYAFFCVGRGRHAFTNDLVWTILLGLGLGVEYALGLVSVAWAVGTFGATAWVAGGYGIIQARVVPALRHARSWLHRTRELGPRFVIENLTLSIGSQLRSVVLAATAGLGEVGAIRGAEMLIGPVAALLMGIAQVAVPETVRALRRGRRTFQHMCLALSSGLGAVSIAWLGVLLVIFPLGVGEVALGQVWPDARALVLPVACSATLGCFQVGPSAGLRAMARADLSWRCQLTATCAYVIFGTAGALVAGAAGTAWGTCIAALIGSCIWTLALRRATEQHFGTNPDPVLRSATLERL